MCTRSLHNEFINLLTVTYIDTAALLNTLECRIEVAMQWLGCASCTAAIIRLFSRVWARDLPLCHSTPSCTRNLIQVLLLCHPYALLLGRM